MRPISALMGLSAHTTSLQAAYGLTDNPSQGYHGLEALCAKVGTNWTTITYLQTAASWMSSWATLSP